MILYFGSTKLLAQKYIGLNVDNDLYFGSDRYYSSGIFFEYGRTTKTPNDSISNFNYVSKHWVLGQEINTPPHFIIQKICQKWIIPIMDGCF